MTSQAHVRVRYEVDGRGWFSIPQHDDFAKSTLKEQIRINHVASEIMFQPLRPDSREAQFAS